MKRARPGLKSISILAILSCALISIGIFIADTTKSVKAESLALQSGKPWGFYQMLTRRWDWGEQIDQEATMLGGNPQLILFFRDLNDRRGFPKAPVAAAAERGLTPVISLEPIIWGRGKEIPYLQAIADGEYDLFFQNWANAAKTFEGELFLRFGFEMNGDWFSWGKQPELFKKTWRRIHTIFTEVGCANVKWMFSPNVIWGNMNIKDGLMAYYPGDAFVDCIGIDGYNFGDHFDKWHRWQSYNEVFETTIAACAAIGKPVYLSEVGCADDKRKAKWMKTFLENASKDERLSGFIYFHHNNPRKGEPNWRLDSDDKTLKVFQKWASASAS